LPLLGQRAITQPPVAAGDLADKRTFPPAHQTGLGNGAVTFSHTHTMQHMTVFVHLKPPIGHEQLHSENEVLFRVSLPDLRFGSEMLLGLGKEKTSAAAGSISPISQWLHFDDHGLAPWHRSTNTGIFAPVIRISARASR
jgi:hypothetical protein